MRVGIGFDVHRLGAERPLRLGGVEVPGAAGLIGHSDADVVLHAIADAILGAAGRDDIGCHFPDDSDEWAGADSRRILGAVMALVAEQGWRVVNVDCTVIAERPKLAPYRARMEHEVARVLAMDPGAVNVKFTTMEGLGAIGEGKGIACHAVCLLEEA